MYSNVDKNKRNTILIMAGFLAIIALFAALFALAFDDWSFFGTVLVVATVYAVFQYFFASRAAVAMTGAKKIEKKDNPRLYNIVENLTLTAGLPMPEVYVMNDPAPNAFAAGRDPNHALVCATTGLLSTMDDKELTAVMAHEVSHVKNYDIRVSTIVFGLVCLIGLIADVGWRVSLRSSGRNRNNDSDGGGIAQIILLLASLLAPFIAALAQMAVSREREYLADASAAMLTRYPEGMIAALKKLQTNGQPLQSQNPAMEAMYISDPTRPGKLLKNLFSTHPPLEDRIKRLEDAKTKF